MSLFQTFKKMQTRGVMIGIGVFTLVTFSVTSAVTATFAKDPREANASLITLPSGKRMKLGQAELDQAHYAAQLFLEPMLFQTAQQERLSKLFMKAYEFLAIGGTLQRNESDKKKKGDFGLQVAMLTALARDRGIEATQNDVETWLADAFASTEEYRRVCGRLRVTAQGFEAGLREALLIRRMVMLAEMQSPLPSGDEIAKEWGERNEAFTFEIAVFGAEARKAKIDPKSITDEQLKKYLDELNEFAKAEYKDPEKYVVEGLAALKPADKQNDAFEAMIAAEKAEESDASTYFQIASAARFKAKKPNPNYVPPASGPATQPAEIPVEFADVKDAAMREVKVARALEKVLSESRDAAAKPDFDLKKIGEKYGLTYFNSGDPKDSAGLRTLPIHGGQSVVVTLGDTKEGEFMSGYQAVEGALQITRVSKKIAPRIPEVAEIRDRVVPKYLDAKSWEQAKEDARDFLSAVKDATGDDRFERVAKERGVDLKTLNPMSRQYRTDPDFLALDSKAPEKFLANQQVGSATADGKPNLFELKVGAFSPLSIDEANKTSYIVKVVARTQPTLADMGPSDYLASRDDIIQTLRLKKMTDALSVDSLGKELKLERPEPAARAAIDGEEGDSKQDAKKADPKKSDK